MKKIRKNQKFKKNQIQKMRKLIQRFSCKIQVMVNVCILLMIFAGCGKDVSVLKQGAMEESISTEQVNDGDIKTQDEQNIEAANPTVIETWIYVDVGGAVEKPGVYALAEGSRVFEAIAQAGGFTENAYIQIINQAKVLLDGEQIYVYTMEEAEERFTQKEWSGMGDADYSDVSIGHYNGKVNLNLADKEALMTLDGIGDTRADAILKYRAEHGAFRSIEDLMQVDGIKEKTYEKIKDCITIQ